MGAIRCRVCGAYAVQSWLLQFCLRVQWVFISVLPTRMLPKPAKEPDEEEKRLQVAIMGLEKRLHTVTQLSPPPPAPHLSPRLLLPALRICCRPAPLTGLPSPARPGARPYYPSASPGTQTQDTSHRLTPLVDCLCTSLGVLYELVC